MSNAEQLEKTKTVEWYWQRKKGIGGSDAAVVLGESPWRTPYELYLEKTSDYIDYTREQEKSETNIPMMIGTACEPFLRKEYTKQTGREVVVPPWKQHETIPYIVGNVDGLADDRIVEIKTARSEWDEVPAYYYLQVQHYLMLYGMQKADIIALFIFNNKIRIYEIEANLEIQEYMKKIYASFWNKVVNRIPPEPTTLDDLKKMYPYDNSESIELSPGTIERIKEITTVKKHIAELEKVVEQNEVEIQSELGENQIGTDSNGNVLVTWKSTKARELVDAARLKKEHPEIFCQYVKFSKPSRTFRIKEKTNE